MEQQAPHTNDTTVRQKLRAGLQHFFNIGTEKTPLNLNTVEVSFPEEDHEIAALPKALLHAELARRLDLEHLCLRLDLDTHEKVLYWREKVIDFSAVSNSQLMHHIALHLNE